MNDLTCEVCMDLIPLVQDGVASEDSRAAVLRHCKTCPACRALYNADAVPEADDGRLLHALRRKLRLLCAFALFLMAFFALSLVNSEYQFYNTLLMPVVGALGYGLWHWRALYEVPLLLLILHATLALASLFRGLGPQEALFSVLWWTAVLSIVSAAGTAVAGLLHYAFKKEETP